MLTKGSNFAALCSTTAFRIPNSQATCHEENLSTKRAETQTHPWFPSTHEHRRRPRRTERPTRTWPGTAKRLTLDNAAGHELPKTHRLLASTGFRRVLRDGRRNSDPLFTVYVADNAFGHPRLGITVARKVSTKSVVRNVIKRQIRESFRKHRHELPAADVVVVARPAAAAQSRATLRDSLQRHWSRVSQLCARS